MVGYTDLVQSVLNQDEQQQKIAVFVVILPETYKRVTNYSAGPFVARGNTTVHLEVERCAPVSDCSKLNCTLPNALNSLPQALKKRQKIQSYLWIFLVNLE